MMWVFYKLVSKYEALKRYLKELICEQFDELIYKLH